jgi:SnoaL-like domain
LRRWRPTWSFYSPIIGPTFRGREAVGALLAGVLENIEDLRYTDELDGAETQVLAFRARFGKREIEAVDILRFDEQGKIREFKVIIRPLTGVIAVAKALGPYVAKSRVSSVLLRLLVGPLGAMVALGERIVPRLIRLGS